jgi:hypothetical protein
MDCEKTTCTVKERIKQWWLTGYSARNSHAIQSTQTQGVDHKGHGTSVIKPYTCYILDIVEVP